MNKVLDKTKNNEETKGVVKQKDVTTLIKEALKENPDITFDEIIELSAFKNRDKKLIPILTSDILPSKNNTPFVMSVNADWGYGKTTFVKLWEAYLKQENYKTIYFNAWENDFSDSSIVPFFVSILEFLKSNNSLMEKGFRLLGKIYRYYNEFVEETGNQVLKKNTGADVKEANKKAIEKADKTLGNKLFQDFKLKQELFKDFKTELEQAVKKEEKPIIIFIDELDRCKPSYAVELLEEIKHLFSVEGFIFVLSINKKALGEIVSCHQGLGNIDEYLEKFIDYPFNLPKPSKDEFTTHLIELYKIPADRDFTIIFTAISKNFDISLRTQKQCFINCKILEGLLSSDKYKKYDQYYFSILIPFLVLLKAKKPKDYYDISVPNNLFDFDKTNEISQYLDLEFKDSVDGISLLALILTAKVNNSSDVINLDNTELSFNNKFDDFDRLNKEKILERLKQIATYSKENLFKGDNITPYVMIQEIYKKIELLNF